MINKGILFDNIHSYDDLNLILSSSEIPPAKPKTTYIDIPGADGSIDLTEANGEVKYSDRTLKFTFTILPDSLHTFEEKKTEVVNLLNGRNFKITQDKDEDFYFEGRCTVASYKADRNLHQITVEAKVKPYKLKHIITKKTVALTGTATAVTIANSRKSVVPSITCTGNTKITFGSGTYSLNAGTHKVLDIVFVEGNNVVSVSGSGNVTFEFREGEL